MGIGHVFYQDAYCGWLTRGNVYTRADGGSIAYWMNMISYFANPKKGLTIPAEVPAINIALFTCLGERVPVGLFSYTHYGINTRLCGTTGGGRNINQIISPSKTITYLDNARQNSYAINNVGYSYIGYRHNNYANVLFFDGHVSSLNNGAIILKNDGSNKADTNGYGQLDAGFSGAAY